MEDVAVRSTALVQTRGLEKRYGSERVVRGASIAFDRGVLHAVCGENGAGKSTLLQMVAGIVQPDAGCIEIEGHKLEPHSPREATRRGVAMVLQHFALIPALTVFENVVLGAEPVVRFGRIDRVRARAKVEQIASELGMALALDDVVEALSLGDRQQVEIARAFFRDASVLILDEPTAVLSPTQSRALYTMLRRFAHASGIAVVVVTHKMDEVRDYADAVTVLRKGSVALTMALERTKGPEHLQRQIEHVSAAMMGVEYPRREHLEPAVPNSAVRAVSATDAAPAVDGRYESVERTAHRHSDALTISVKDVYYKSFLRGVSLDVRASEIVGIAGVEGNGQRELVALLAGDIAPDSGRVEGRASAVIREDRHRDAVVLDASVQDNLLLGDYASFQRTWFGFRFGLDRAAMTREALRRLEASGVETSLQRPVRELSGGNQQKLVVARALGRLAVSRQKVLVAYHPTRGVDMGASAHIHDALRDAARSGAAVVVVSADLSELRALCTRIGVLFRGKMAALLDRSDSDETFGRAMLGGAPRAEEVA